MKAINRKLLRELSRMRGQVASIGLVVAAGVALMVSFAGALLSLQGAADAFYRQARLADLFVSLTRAPESLADRLRAIPGVAAVDSVEAVINGRLVPFQITGIAVSAEYVFAVRPGDFVPDDRRFGIFWLPRDDLASAIDMQGAFNDVALTLAPGASGADVAARIDSLLAPYGGRSAVPLARQLSYESLENEFRQLRVQSFLLPAIFLGVAAFLLNVVLARIIGSQRPVIAVLKAFGYHGAEVARH